MQGNVCYVLKPVAYRSMVMNGQEVTLNSCRTTIILWHFELVPYPLQLQLHLLSRWQVVRMEILQRATEKISKSHPLNRKNKWSSVHQIFATPSSPSPSAPLVACPAPSARQSPSKLTYSALPPPIERTRGIGRNHKKNWPLISSIN